jgi:hypothetical protein
VFGAACQARDRAVCDEVSGVETVVQFQSHVRPSL